MKNAITNKRSVNFYVWERIASSPIITHLGWSKHLVRSKQQQIMTVLYLSLSLPFRKNESHCTVIIPHSVSMYFYTPFHTCLRWVLFSVAVMRFYDCIWFFASYVHSVCFNPVNFLLLLLHSFVWFCDWNRRARELAITKSYTHHNWRQREREKFLANDCKMSGTSFLFHAWNATHKTTWS